MTNCHELDHGHWEVKTKSGSNSGEGEPASEADGSFNITIVKPPSNIILEPANINVNILFKDQLQVPIPLSQLTPRFKQNSDKEEKSYFVSEI